jgi:hypothetical protein
VNAPFDSIGNAVAVLADPGSPGWADDLEDAMAATRPAGVPGDS